MTLHVVIGLLALTAFTLTFTAHKFDLSRKKATGYALLIIAIVWVGIFTLPHENPDTPITVAKVGTYFLLVPAVLMVWRYREYRKEMADHKSGKTFRDKHEIRNPTKKI